MTTMENSIRQLLRQGKPTMGTHLLSTWPTLWEAVGSTNQFDYVEFDSQDGAWDLYDLDNMCRAAELTKTGKMIKIDRNPKDWLAKRAVAAGFEAVLFADIMTAREARECVQAVRLPPEGINSFLSTRGIPRHHPNRRLRQTYRRHSDRDNGREVQAGGRAGRSACNRWLRHDPVRISRLRAESANT